MEQKITVLGAGIVGVCCALALQRLGAHVTLIDRGEPSGKTSFGSAGVLARSSLVPFSNPALWKALPRYCLNNSPQLRYSLGYMLRNWSWAFDSLSNARQSRFKQTVAALNSLIALSADLHRQWIAQAGAERYLRDEGWLHLYRTESAFASKAWVRRIYEEYGLSFEVLDSAALHMLEPSVKSIFARAVWIKDTMSLDDPQAVVKAYARLFTANGGTIVRTDIRHVGKGADNQWLLQEFTGLQRETSCLVVALGPWTADMLLPLGIRIPMVYARGYHMHYAIPDAAALGRPIYDTGGDYILAPIQKRGGKDGKSVRLSTGIELNDQMAAPSVGQIEMAQEHARQGFPLGEAQDSEAWLGSRPILPDCRPMIGAVSRHAGLWLATGHHHIGLNTGPATGELLAALMGETEPPVDPTPFDPKRYLFQS